MPDGTQRRDQRKATEASVQNAFSLVWAALSKFGVVALIAMGSVLFMGAVVYAGVQTMNANLLKHMADYNQDALTIRFMLREICANGAATEEGKRRCYATADEIQREMRH